MLAVKIKKGTLISISIVVVMLLLVPFIGMQFNPNINWNVSDFLLAGVILFTAGLAVHFVIRKLRNSKYKFLVLLAIVIGVILIWAEIAVGFVEKVFTGF